MVTHFVAGQVTPCRRFKREKLPAWVAQKGGADHSSLDVSSSCWVMLDRESRCLVKHHARLMDVDGDFNEVRKRKERHDPKAWSRTSASILCKASF